MFQQGLGANHPDAAIERLHPAPFAFLDAEKLIRFFSKTGERVLDPFAGVASTLKACAIAGRLGTGIEISGQFRGLARKRLLSEIAKPIRDQFPQRILAGDARRVVAKFDDDAFQFILTSPPYWSILSRTGAASQFPKGATPYGNDARDFALIENYESFVAELAKFLNSLKRVLAPSRYMAIIVSDFRFKDRLHAFHADLINAVGALNESADRKLVLQGITILAQNSKKLYPYGFPTTYVPNIHHQYVLIFRNIEKPKAPKPKVLAATSKRERTKVPARSRPSSKKKSPPKKKPSAKAKPSVRKKASRKRAATKGSHLKRHQNRPSTGTEETPS